MEMNDAPNSICDFELELALNFFLTFRPMCGIVTISSSEANTAEALILLGSRRFLCMAFFVGFTSAEKFFSNGADAEFPGEYDTLN